MLKGMDAVFAVYEEKSFSKAAEKLYISQPALSNTVKKVERELGLLLFDRSTSPIRLTPAGEYYIQCIRKVKAIDEEMDAHFAEMRRASAESLSVGAGTFFCAHLLPCLAKRFEADFPGCKIQLSENNARELYRSLTEGRLDLTMDTEAWDDEALVTEFLCREHILLAVPASYTINEELAARRLTFEQVRSGLYLEPETPAVDLALFRELPFLLLREGNDIHRRALQMCRSAGFEPRVEMVLDQLYTSYCVAQDGRGAAFVRTGITHAVPPTDRLYFYRLADSAARRDVFLHYRRHSPANEVRAHFIEFMKQHAPGPLR